jgi:hypothetical protein
VNRFDVLAQADTAQMLGKLLHLFSQAASRQNAVTGIGTSFHKRNLTT